MPLPRHDGTNSTSITTSSDHAEVASVKPDGILDLARSNIHLHTVVHPHSWVGITNSSAIRSVQEGHVLRPSLDLAHTTQLILGFSSSYAVDNEPALDIVDDTEVLPSLLNLDNIHKSSGESGISSQLSINFDQSLLADGFHFLHSKGILQPVPKEKGNGKRLP